MKSPYPFIPARRALLLLALMLGACDNAAWDEVDATLSDRFPSVELISTDSLATWLNDPTMRAPIFLDARTEEEFAVSHLYGAYRVDLDEDWFPFLQNVSSSTPIVTYCSIGLRGAALAERLLQQGYTNVLVLDGSLFKWANEGRPVVRDDEEVLEVHPENASHGRLLNQELHVYEPQ